MKSLRDEWAYLVSTKFPIVAIMLPLIAALAYALLLPNGQVNEGRVAVIDQDNSSYSRELIQKLGSSQYIHVATVVPYSENPEEFFTHENYLAVISIPKGLEENRRKSLPTTIGLIIDNTSTAATASIKTAVTEITVTENMAISAPKLHKDGLNEEQVKGSLSSLSVEQRLLYNPTGSYINSTVMAFVGMLSFLWLNINSLPLIARLRMQHKLGTEVENPFGLISRTLPYALFSGAGFYFGLAMLKAIGGARFAGNPFMLLIPLFLYVVGTVLLNMIVAWKAAHPGEAASKMIIVLMPAFVLSGSTLPAAIFPPLAEKIGHFFPYVWFFKFVRGMGLRGTPLSSLTVELGSMMLYVGVLALLVIFLAQKEKQKMMKQQATETIHHAAPPQIPKEA